MGVVRHASAASNSRHADVDIYPYSARSGAGRQLQPKHTSSSYGPLQTFYQALTPGVQLSSPILYSSSPLSPGALSWASGDSADTGTSYHLARKRGVSAPFYTPTSSTQASPSALPDTSNQNRSFWIENQQHVRQNQQDFPPDPSLSPPVVLRGLGLPLKEHSFTDPQAYPSHNIDVIHFHTASPPSRQTRPGVRWRPLSPDARENAGAVRDSGGSCIRCFIMREKCDAGIPCSRCVSVSGRARSWKLPCTRQWLDQRGDHLLPHVLTSQLEIKNMDNFINNGTFFALEGSRMEVPLSIGFGQPLVLEAVEVEVIGNALTSKHGFAPGLGAFSLRSPPIVPCWPVKVDVIYFRVQTWMTEVLAESGSEYPDKCFPRPHPARHRHILALIHQHYQFSSSLSRDDSCVVKSALCLSVAIYVMGHALTVPTHSISHLYSQLRHPDFQNPNLPPSAAVSPRAINKVVKGVICRLVQHLVHKTFTQIHHQLGPKLSPTASFEAAFSSSFLLLTALAQIQASLYERAIAGSKADPPDPTFRIADARAEIHRMDDELTRYIVSLFLHRYKPRKSKEKGTGNVYLRSPASSGSPSSGSGSGSASGATFTSSPLGNVGFREALQGMLQKDKEDIRAASRELSEGKLEEELFQESGVRNVTRVLARLCAPLIED